MQLRVAIHAHTSLSVVAGEAHVPGSGMRVHVDFGATGHDHHEMACADGRFDVGRRLQRERHTAEVDSQLAGSEVVFRLHFSRIGGTLGPLADPALERHVDERAHREQPDQQHSDRDRARPRGRTRS